MEYLVTGGAGFIGHNFWKKYGGIRVDDLSKGKREVDLEMDVTSDRFIDWLLINRPKHIIHLAGQSSGERSEEDPYNDFVRNFIATKRLLKACLHYTPESITIASSVSIYGIKSSAIETDRPEPLSKYGWHKYMSEILLEDYCNFYPHVKGNALRFFNVYGTGQDEWDLQQGMLSIFIALAKKGHIAVKGPGNRIRDFIHVDDAVDAIHSAVHRSKGNPYEAINIASGIPRTISDIVKDIAKVTGASYEFLDERTPGDADFSYANIDKSRTLLDFDCEDKLDAFIQRL